MTIASRRCIVCQCLIPKARLEALPDTTTCVKCSVVRPLTEFDVEIDKSDNELPDKDD